MLALFAIGCSSFLADTVVADVVVEQVLTGLQNPCGVAVQPGSNDRQYAVFVADTGARRIVMHPSDRRHTALPIVTGFSPDEIGNAPSSIPSAGPLGLLFLDQRRLVVSVAGDDEAIARLYELPNGSLPLAANQATQQLNSPRQADNGDALCHGVYALARTRANDHVPDLLILMCFRGDEGFDLWKVPVRAGTLGEPAPFVADEIRLGSHNTRAVVVSEQGFLVAAEQYAGDRPTQLTFYEPVEGRMLMQVPVEISELVALAYSPRGGNLYAADFGSEGDRQGGVYRIDDPGEPGRLSTATVKVADVPRPTSMAFGPDGALYVAALGEPNNDDANTGVLLKLTGEL